MTKETLATPRYATRGTGRLAMANRLPRAFYNTMSVLIVGGIAAAAIIGLTQGKSARILRPISVASNLMPLGAAPSLGTTGTAAIMVVFSDFQCPFCRMFARETLPHVIETYVSTGKVRLVFKHLLDQARRPLGLAAAQLAECSRFGSDDAFWRTLERLFEPGSLNGSTLRELATRTGLGPAEMDACARSDQTRNRIAEDTKAAQLVGIRATPAILLGWLRADDQLEIDRGFTGAGTREAVLAELDRVIGDRSRIDEDSRGTNDGHR